MPQPGNHGISLTNNCMVGGGEELATGTEAYLQCCCSLDAHPFKTHRPSCTV